MQPDLYSQYEPRDVPLDGACCEWAVHLHKRGVQVRQCSRKVQTRVNGHFYCNPHAKMVRHVD